MLKPQEIIENLEKIKIVHSKSRRRSYAEFLKLLMKVDSSRLIYTPMLKLANEYNSEEELKEYLKKHLNRELARSHEILALVCMLPPKEVRFHALEALRLSNYNTSKLNPRITMELKSSSFNLHGSSELKINMPYNFSQDYKDIKNILVIAENGTDLTLLNDNLPDNVKITLIAADRDIGTNNAGNLLKTKYPDIKILNNTNGDFESYSPEDIEICRNAREISADIVKDIYKQFNKYKINKDYRIYQEELALRLEDRIYPNLRDAFIMNMNISGNYDAYFIVHSSNTYFKEAVKFFEAKNKPVFVCSSSRSISLRVNFQNFLNKQDERDKFKLYNLMSRHLEPQKMSKEDFNIENYPDLVKSKVYPEKESILVVGSTSKRYESACSELFNVSFKEDDTHVILTNSSKDVMQYYDEKIEEMAKDSNNTISVHHEPYRYDMIDLLDKRIHWSYNLFHEYIPKLLKKKFGKRLNLLSVAPLMLSIEHFIIRDLPSFFEYFVYMDNLFATNKIKFVIAIPGRDPKVGMTIKRANKENISTLDVQAFFLSEHPRYRTSIADKVCVIDTDAKYLYTNHFKVREDKVYLAGSIPIDINVAKLNKYKVEAIKKDLKIKENKRVITFATQPWNYDVFEDSFQIMLDTYKDDKDVVLILKFHPNDSSFFEQKLNSMAKKSGMDVIFNRDKDIFEIIKVSDAFITVFSNVGLEAAISGLPVVSANINNDKLPVNLAEKGVAVEAKNRKELKNLLEKLRTEEGTEYIVEAQSRFKEENSQMYSLDTSKRIVELGYKISGR